MQGKGANRMDFRTHIDDVLLSMKNEEFEDAIGEKEQDTEALIKLTEVAALKDHPGWFRIREILQQKVDDYRAGTPMEAVVADPNVDDAKYGQLMRSCLMVAKELESVLAFVDVASQTVEQEKERKREERIRDAKGRFTRTTEV